MNFDEFKKSSPPQKNRPLDKIDERQELLSEFIEFRHRRSEDLPEKIIDSNNPQLNSYKCRGNFWAGVVSRINYLIDQGIIKNPEAIAKGQQFIQYTRGLNWLEKRAREDIDEINKIMDYFIKELSN